VTDTAIATPESTAPPASDVAPPPVRAPRKRLLIALAIVGLMVFSLIAHLGALTRDLPLQEADEEFFVEPAVEIAATGDLNPHWFGHPGSTLIYPIAALVHVWDAALHDGPILGTNEELRARFDEHPKPFYVIGRLWTITLALATIPVLYALGRRAFNRRVALIGVTLWTVLPYGIHHGRIVRTETAAVFFGTVALYFCVRAWQEPRRRWWVLTGISTGFAISSRWFMVALLPCIVAAAVIPARRNLRSAVRAAAYSVVTAIAGFLATTPYFLLDLDTARRDIRAEAELTHEFADGLSPAGNGRWYLTEALPNSMTWAIYILALAGILLIFRRRLPYQVTLVAFTVLFLIGISASKWHWQRWAIQVLPLLALFAAFAVHEATRWLAARAPERLHAGTVIPVVATALLVVAPLVDLVDVNRYDSAPSTRGLAREWMQDNVPRGSRVVQLEKLFNVRPRNTAPLGNEIEVSYDLDPSRPLQSYRDDGYDYVATFGGDPFKYMSQPQRYPAEAAFYTELACETRLVASFGRTSERDGLGIQVYRLDQAPVELLDLACSQPQPD
jgi:4-amino-4-deoxy-L-arabinose transferase-like glycosyltransferase